MARQESTLDDAARLATPIPLTEDVLQMAREARKNQGIHEQEVSFSGEAGLQDSLICCEKNPGHKRFTPISELCYERLPEAIRYPNVADFLVSKAQETVRLSCFYTSTERPDNYCFSNYRGRSDLTRYGSGRVWSVYLERVRYDIPCPFSDCTEQHGTERNEGVENMEDVKGREERKHDVHQSVAEEFFNEGSGKHKKQIDSSCLKDETRSVHVRQALTPKATKTQNNRIHEKVECEVGANNQTADDGVHHRLTFTQTTSTAQHEQNQDGVRCECSTNNQNENLTGDSCKNETHQSIENDNDDQKTGDSDTFQDYQCSRVHSKSTLEKCDKNLTAKTFDNNCSNCCENKVDTFGSNSSNETGLNKLDSHTNSKSVDRCNVSCSERSSQREILASKEEKNPEQKATSETPQPEYNVEESQSKENPTPIFETDTLRKTASDTTVQPASPRHHVSGYFRIHTAKHVVFNDEEAQRTIVEFFYDDPRDLRRVIRARGVRVARSDLEGDYCVLDCVTHDRNLGPALDQVRRQWSGLWLQVKDVIYGADVSMVVSHPHGCSKQFSTGRCLSREWGEVPGGQGWYRYTYDAATCPGSSGAPVWVAGSDGLFSGYAPHSGSFNPDVARSAVWFFWNQQKNQ